MTSWIRHHRSAVARGVALALATIAAVVLVVHELHPTPQAPLVSALIVTHNRPQFLVNSLRLLELQGMLRAKHATTITPNTPPLTLTPPPHHNRLPQHRGGHY